MSVRQPAVAGAFYPAGAAELKKLIESCFVASSGPGVIPQVNQSGPRNILGLVSPHAGYIYSGSIAAHSYYALAEDGLPEVAVILGPNHRAYRPAVALTDEVAWRTPLGDTTIDNALVSDLAASCPAMEVKSSAHYMEHSLEVQLPFLQYLGLQSGQVLRVVPALIGSPYPADLVTFVQEIGECIADTLLGRNAVVIASTDFTHYESSETASAKDSRAISAILSLDEVGLLETVQDLDISMCGVLPTAIAIYACKKLGAVYASELAYGNSGDVTGDRSEVVGYAALSITK